MMETQDLFPEIGLTTPALPPVAEGLAARDRGIALVAAHDPGWQDATMRELLKWAWSRPQRDPDCNPKWALEEFRHYHRHVLKGTEPRHHNEWGALTKHPEFKAHIATLGETRRSYHKAAKARRVLLYFLMPSGITP